MRAVDRPALRHHKNCVVFPSTASHSVPDSMASGDLDGDMYFVCWDPDLIPPKEIAPLDRTPSAASGAAPTRSLSDMPTAAVQTFMQLKFNRLLGMMANEWTKQVEMSPELAEAPYPRELAPLIESALESDTSVDLASRAHTTCSAGSHEVGRGLRAAGATVQVTQEPVWRSRSERFREPDPATSRHGAATAECEIPGAGR